MALLLNMLIVLIDMDVVLRALVDALEGSPLEHLFDHRVQICQLFEACLALATLLVVICLIAVPAHDLVTPWTVFGFHGDVVAVGTGGSCEHGIWARVELDHLRLDLP